MPRLLQFMLAAALTGLSACCYLCPRVSPESLMLIVEPPPPPRDGTLSVEYSPADEANDWLHVQ